MTVSFGFKAFTATDGFTMTATQLSFELVNKIISVKVRRVRKSFLFENGASIRKRPNNAFEGFGYVIIGRLTGGASLKLIAKTVIIIILR